MAVRAGRFSDYQANIWLTALAAQNLYLGIFTADPFGVGSPATVEISGAGYARVTAIQSLSGRVVTVTNTLLWNGIPAGSQITHIGAWDAAFNGNLVLAGPVPNSPIAFPNGGFLSVAANKFHYGLDS